MSSSAKTSCLATVLCVACSSSSGNSTGASGAAGALASAGSQNASGGGTVGTGGTSTSTGGTSTSTGGTSTSTGGASASTGGASTGGTSNGSGGTGGLPHQVGQCDKLGAVGVWEEISPFRDPGDFVLDPRNAGTVYVGSAMDGNGVWRTTDCGSTWTDMSTGTNSNRIKAGRQTTFKIDPVNGTLYTNSLYGNNGVYRSSNNGVDWDDVTPSGQGMIDFVGHIDIDPDNPKHLLALFHAGCGGDSQYPAGGCFGETTDAGATWKAHYGNPAFPSEVMVFLLHGNTWIAAADGLQRTTDGGVTWTKVSGNGAGGHSTRPPYRASDGTYYAGTMNGILRGTGDGTAWSLLPNTGTWLLGATGNGKNAYVAGQAGVWTSPESDGLKWTVMPGSPSHSDGCSMDPRAFDQDHHVLYVSCFDGDGMWRMRTE